MVCSGPSLFSQKAQNSGNLLRLFDEFFGKDGEFWGKKSFFFLPKFCVIKKNNFPLKRSNLVVKDAFGERYFIWTNYKLLIMAKMLFW